MARGPLIGAIEAGGTKFVCALGRTVQDIRNPANQHRVPTTPTETLAKVVNFFSAHEKKPDAIGVASFGPLDLEGKKIGQTPKSKWSGFDWAETFRIFDSRVALDTDVNGAALAEWHWGASAGKSPMVYLTIGTGIGGGVVIDGKAIHGLLHPEMGHMRIPRLRKDTFAGSCPFHADCLEGLASGRAIELRWHNRGEDLPRNHPAWEFEAHYLALAVTNVITTISPELIILGGGVMNPTLMEGVRSGVRDLLMGYLGTPWQGGRGCGVVLTAPSLAPDSGLLGGFALGQAALGLTGEDLVRRKDR